MSSPTLQCVRSSGHRVASRTLAARLARPRCCTLARFLPHHQSIINRPALPSGLTLTTWAPLLSQRLTALLEEYPVASSSGTYLLITEHRIFRSNNFFDPGAIADFTPLLEKRKNSEVTATSEYSRLFGLGNNLKVCECGPWPPWCVVTTTTVYACMGGGPRQALQLSLHCQFRCRRMTSQTPTRPIPLPPSSPFFCCPSLHPSGGHKQVRPLY